jgi:hypothetical protein
MKKSTWMNIAAIAVGVALGPCALASAKASRPPIEWSAIPFVFVGSVVAAVFVIGVQVLRSNPQHGRFAFCFFTPLSMFFLGSGVRGIATAILRGEFGPASILILAIGLGSVFGVFFSRMAYRMKFKNVL